MSKLKYVKGDATDPQGDGIKFVIHVCNNKGGWGAGFVLAISKKWPWPVQRYRLWKRNGRGFQLGNIQVVKAEDEIFVINMIGQDDIREQNGIPPIRYEAVDKCLAKVAILAQKYKASVHLPYLMGSGLAGGKWEKIEEILEKRLCDQGINVIAYDFEDKLKLGDNS